MRHLLIPIILSGVVMGSLTTTASEAQTTAGGETGAARPGPVSTPVPGSWVRVTTTTPEVHGKSRSIRNRIRTLEGVVEALDETTLSLGTADDDAARAILLNSITRLDVRRRPSKQDLGGLIGAPGGGALGYATGASKAGPSPKISAFAARSTTSIPL